MALDTTPGPGGENSQTPVRRRASAWATLCVNIFGSAGGDGDLAADGGVDE